ncbi:MAG: hypothetical protein JKY48_13920 [Flavobacteriales bacterium]|nr:hypothetical protein [Flavobacteriales bacterium]
MQKRERKNQFLFSLCTIALITIIGCNNPPQKKDDQNKAEPSLSEHVAQYHKMQAGDEDYIHKHTSLNAPYELNLADDKQYRYVLHNLKAGGKTPEKHPALFNDLKMQRESSKASPPQVAEVWTDAKTDGLSDINILQNLYSHDGITYNASGRSSIYDGVNSSSMMFIFGTINAEKKYTAFHTSNTTSKYGSQTENWTRQLNSSVPVAKRGEKVKATVIITTSANGGPHGNTYIQSSNNNSNATDICVTAPNHGIEQNASIASCPVSYTTGCVNKDTAKLKTPIVSCYGRNNSIARANCGNCNYGYPRPGHPDSLALLVSGSITFPNDLLDNGGKPVGNFRMYLLHDTTTGGGCILHSQYDTASTFPANFTIDLDNPKQLNYCFRGGDFTSRTCFKDLVSTKVELILDVNAILNDFTTSQATVSRVYCDSANRADPTTTAWCANIPQICIVQGCLAKGTMITLADGSTKPVEDFVGGEMVQSSGKDRQVGATTTGKEFIPIYRIKTENGKKVIISSRHPIPTSDGMKLVRNLKVGDEVTTEEGPSQISSIIKEKYDQTVHNFTVGDDGDAAEGVANMYANGILVGDLASQAHYAHIDKKRGRTLDELKEEISAEWHKDLESDFNSK